MHCFTSVDNLHNFSRFCAGSASKTFKTSFFRIQFFLQSGFNFVLAPGNFGLKVVRCVYVFWCQIYISRLELSKAIFFLVNSGFCARRTTAIGLIQIWLNVDYLFSQLFIKIVVYRLSWPISLIGRESNGQIEIEYFYPFQLKFLAV